MKTRTQRRRDFYHARIQEATSPSERMSRALDYLRALLTELPAENQNQVATAITTQILRTADTVQKGHRK